MAELALNQSIFCLFGGKDDLLSQIKAVPDGEPLELQVNSGGGLCSEGRVLYQAIKEHKGETTFKGVGIVASMAAVLMGAFDKVKLESSCDIMFHKGRPMWWEIDEGLSDDEQYLIDRFNTLAYNDLKEKGVDEEFLSMVYLSGDMRDHWITAQRAEELNIGSVFKTVRKDSAPIEVIDSFGGKTSPEKIEAYYGLQMETHSGMLVASANKGTQFKLKNMFNNKKIMRSVKLANGTEACFVGKKQTPAVGDMLTPIGSDKPLRGDVLLADGKTLTLSNNQVTGIANADDSPDTEDMVSKADFDALEVRVKALEDKGTGDTGDTGDTADTKDTKDTADTTAAVTTAISDMQGDMKNMATVIENLCKVTGNSYEPPKKPESKSEGEGSPETGRNAYLGRLAAAKHAALGNSVD